MIHAMSISLPATPAVAPTGPPRRDRGRARDEPALLGGRGGGAARRADPGARARALRVRQVVRRAGDALLDRLRAAPVRLHARRDRVPAVAGAARRLRAPAGRGSRARPSRPSIASAAARCRTSRCGSATRSSSRGRLQSAAAAADLLRALHRAAHAAAADHRLGAAEPAGGRGRVCCPATASRPSTASRSATGRTWSASSPIRSGTRCASGSAAAPTPRSATSRRCRSSARGRCSARRRVGWIGVSPRFHLPEIGVLDPNSPAAQAGLKTFDFVTSINGAAVATWAEFAKAVEHAGASPLRISYLRGGYSAVPFAHIEIQRPASAVVIPVAIFDGAGHRRYETGLTSAELFVFSVEPGSPADQIGIRRGDQILELDGAAAAALGSAAPAAGGQPAAHVQDLLAVAGRAAPRGVVPARGALGARRLPPGGGAPGVRRDEPPGLEDRAAGAGAQPLRLRGHALVRAHRATSSWP